MTLNSDLTTLFNTVTAQSLGPPPKKDGLSATRGIFTSWEDLNFWQSGEWEVIQERLDEYDVAGTLYNPKRTDMFNALDACPYQSTTVCILGQDPYPDPVYCTGIAFDIPDNLRRYPASLFNIFREYSSDLHYPTPRSPTLDRWCKQGVLLWNAYPSCETGKPGSHRWPEWEELTKEIITKLEEKGDVIFVELGAVARSFSKWAPISVHIQTSHPSPLGAHRGFLGSRIFSAVNSHLVDIGKDPIDWRLL